LLKRLLSNQPVEPEAIVTDGLASCRSAVHEHGLEGIRRPGRLRESNRAKNSYLPIHRLERTMKLFRNQALAQRFLTTHAGISNTISTQRHLISRTTLRILRSAANDVSPAETAET